MTHGDIISLFIALAVLLGTARLFGEIARWFNQPSVIGELLAGIVLGPTLLGSVAPNLSQQVFPDSPGFSMGLQGLTTVAITLFLLVAGIEVNLSSIFRQGKSALGVSIGGIILPFLLGFAVGWVGPHLVSGEALGCGARGSPFVFALFLATTMSISALPVIAKTLMDLNLYRSEFGMTVIASAVMDDLIGWIFFAVILGMLGGTHTGASHLATTIGLTLVFVVLMLTLVRFLVHRSLPFIQAHASWPGGVLGFAVVLAFASGAFMEWAGIHAIFGSFISGVALGDSSHLKERTKKSLDSFVTFIFAPLFFSTVGLKVNFLTSFDLPLVTFVVVIACVGKLVGCGLAARWVGLSRRESWAIGAAMNARGSMEIILALLAMEAGLINQRLFVALVVMALFTSVIAGPIMKRILNRGEKVRFTEYLGSKAFDLRLAVTDRVAAVTHLCRISGASGIAMDEAIAAVLARERLSVAGIGNGISLMQTRLPHLDKPRVAIGISSPGVDCDSPDGEPCHVFCLILTGEADASLGLELYRDAAVTLHNKELYKKIMVIKSYTEFLALLAEHRGTAEPPSDSPASGTERSGVIVVGANGTARALAKLLSPGRAVCLIDSNSSHVAEAKKRGLNAFVGNALDIALLSEAKPETAEWGLLLLANDEINSMAARQLQKVFHVPQLGAVTKSDPAELSYRRQSGPSARYLFGRATDIGEWDYWFSREAIDIERWSVPAGKSVEDFFPIDGGPQILILAVERQIGDQPRVEPYTNSTVVAEGDVILFARARTSERLVTDVFDNLVQHCSILDVEESLDREAFFTTAADALSKQIGKSSAEISAALHERESMSSTVVASGLAIPHLMLNGNGLFSMLVVRCKQGINFGSGSEPVHAAFVLAETPDERNQHLKVLAAIVQVTQSVGFQQQWRKAEGISALRAILLNAPRERMA